MQASVGGLVAKTLASSTSNPYAAGNAARNTPAALDVFSVQASTKCAHCLALLAQGCTGLPALCCHGWRVCWLACLLPCQHGGWQWLCGCASAAQQHTHTHTHTHTGMLQIRQAASCTKLAAPCSTQARNSETGAVLRSTILAHFLSLAFSNWLLRKLNSGAQSAGQFKTS